MSKSTIIMVGLFVFAVLGTPVIFYGVLAMGEAGFFDNALDNFWLIAGAGIGFVVIVWTAMVFIGSRAVAADAHKDQLNG